MRIGHIKINRLAEVSMGILNTLLRAVTWWHGQSLGTQLFTSRNGVKVGEDDAGNVFYETKDRARRWVIFDGEPEASRVGPEWHGWLHHTYDDPPTKAPLKRKDWEKPHQENLTGTAMAYAPAGSLRQSRPADRSDYEAWTPE
jgi:NADH:ubiquinone oxidoreductase subunit